jgi:hypothetical protein
VNLPDRDYILLSATIEAIGEGVLSGVVMAQVGPNLWWPDDQAWCVATEVDFLWTYVAGTKSCIKDLLSDSRVEALVTEPQHRGDYLSDVINGPVTPP